MALSKIETHLADKQNKPAEQGPALASRDVTTLEARGRASLYAATWEPVASGSRNQAAFRHAAQLRNDFLLAESDAWGILAEWNATNNPPLAEPELRAVFGSGRAHAKRPPGTKLDRDRPACREVCESTADIEAAAQAELARQTQCDADLAASCSGAAFTDTEQDKSGTKKPVVAVVDACDWLVKEPPVPDQIIVDMFDRGDKICGIGPSKVRKSFFHLQMMLSIASGRDFLGFGVPQPRSVFAIQFEIQAHHFHRRVRRLAQAMGITSTDLDNRLQIVNARGLHLTGVEGIRRITEIAKPFAPDLIFFDPLYKVATGVENSAEDFKIVLDAFDELAEATSAAVVYVHHDAKGYSGGPRHPRPRRGQQRSGPRLRRGRDGDAARI